MITITAESTSERKEKAKRIFEDIKSLLEEGYSYGQAFHEKGYFKTPCSAKKYAWSKDVIEYGESQGYPYNKPMKYRKRRNGVRA